MNLFKLKLVIGLVFALVLSSAFVGCGDQVSGEFNVLRYEATSNAGKNIAFSVSCGINEKLLAGGCSCANGGGITSSLRTSEEGWSCACNTAPTSGSHQVVALCTSKSSVSRREVLNTNSLLGSASASCLDSETRMGSGALCGPSLAAAEPLNRIGYFSTSAKAECVDPSGSGTVTAQCISGGPTVEDLREDTALSTTATKTLACTDGKTLVGGQCDCPENYTLLEYFPQSDSKTLRCTCAGSTAGTLSVRVLCAN